METISVILSTYNGKCYLRELMDSLRNQTRQPDEVLVSDDASSDGTAELVSSYIDEYGLTNWRVIVNEKNIGWKANFKRGILACSGDLVFLCDQDDIWDLRKIELMSDVMEENPEFNVLACKVNPFYEGKNEIYQADKVQRGSELVSKLDLNGSDFLYTMRPGCAFCVRSGFARDVEPWWKETYPHDAVLWRFAAITGSLGLYGRQLVSFRRHSDNASARGCLTRETRLTDVDYYIDFFKQVRGYLSQRGLLDDQRDSLTLHIDAWLNSRRHVLVGEAKRSDIRTIWAGRRWYSTWKSPLVDFYFFFRPNGRLHA